ncbi:MAG: heterodisulfide reductase-related iron-sulfur binding cluster, partial [Gemmatimonadaceae bacterium]
EDENDSPRGRIVLMPALLEGRLEPENDSIETHIGQCLGCCACETACPSGVPYGKLLEATRETLAQHRPIPAVARVILWVFERRWLLRLAMAAGRVTRATGIARLFSGLPGRPGFAMAMLSSTRRAAPAARPEPRATNTGAPVALLTGCVMEGLFAETNRATERVLAINGYGMRNAPAQVCCGALHVHAGDANAARRLARTNIAAFENANADYICVNAAGCGAMMKEYPHLLADDPEWAERAVAIAGKVRDVSELLAAAGPVRGGPLHARVCYDAPCHLMHAQRITGPPLDVLHAIPELELVPLNESDVCCGSAGIYNLVEPHVSDVVLARKLENIASASPDMVATGNPGCLMQIGAGLLRAGSATRAVHPVELLDASYARRDSAPPR